MPGPTYAFRSTAGLSRGAKFKQHIDEGGTPDSFPGRPTTATRRWARDKGMKFDAEYEKPNRRKFTEEEDKMILEHRSKGFSTRDIGEKMGTTKNTIIGRLDRLRKAGSAVETKPADTARAKPSLPKLAFMEKPMEDE